MRKGSYGRPRWQRAGAIAAATCVVASIALSTPAGAVGADGRHAIAPAAATPVWPWMNTSLSPDRRARLVLAQMTVAEKVDLMSGNQGDGPYAFYASGIPRLGIPALAMADSASGVHAHGAVSTNTGENATAMPSAQAMGATWSTSAIIPYATAVTNEVRATGQNVLLSPVGDILRNPYWGRTNESPSEDPTMTANYLSTYTKVTQSQHVIATLKHYLAYNQETNRSNGQNDIISTLGLPPVTGQLIMRLMPPEFDGAVRTVRG